MVCLYKITIFEKSTSLDVVNVSFLVKYLCYILHVILGCKKYIQRGKIRYTFISKKKTLLSNIPNIYVFNIPSLIQIGKITVKTKLEINKYS